MYQEYCISCDNTMFSECDTMFSECDTMFSECDTMFSECDTMFSECSLLTENNVLLFAMPDIVLFLCLSFLVIITQLRKWISVVVVLTVYVTVFVISASVRTDMF